MFSLIWLPVALQLLVPITLLVILAMGFERSDAAWVLTALSTGLYLSVIAAAGMWLLVPGYLPAVYAVAFIAALIFSLRRASSRKRWPSGRIGWSTFTARTSVCILIVWLAVYAASGRRAPDLAVSLAFPLRHGTYLVVNGGSNTLVNAHLGLPETPRYRAYRGQRNGVDIVRVNAFGVRAQGFLPSDPQRYAIFGDSIFSPCAGDVIQAVDGVRDVAPPNPDRAHMAGNHVLMKCGVIWILLGHMQQGTIGVKPGERVPAGGLLGRVGNTGNTNEPHLHIHAQTAGTQQEPFGGEPLPIRLDGRFPVRNDWFRVR
jgi:hypothetical protein